MTNVIWVLIWVSARNAFSAGCELNSTKINYMKEDRRSYRRNYCSCKKKAWTNSGFFLRISFRNYKRWVYNCNDLLSYNSSLRSFHIRFSCIGRFHLTSRRSCWCSKRNESCGSSTLFLSKHFLLFQYICIDPGHMDENVQLITSSIKIMLLIQPPRFPRKENEQ